MARSTVCQAWSCQASRQCRMHSSAPQLHVISRGAEPPPERPQMYINRLFIFWFLFFATAGPRAVRRDTRQDCIAIPDQYTQLLRSKVSSSRPSVRLSGRSGSGGAPTDHVVRPTDQPRRSLCTVTLICLLHCTTHTLYD